MELVGGVVLVDEVFQNGTRLPDGEAAVVGVDDGGKAEGNELV